MEAERSVTMVTARGLPGGSDGSTPAKQEAQVRSLSWDIPGNLLPRSGWSNEWLTEDSSMALVGRQYIKRMGISFTGCILCFELETIV